MASHHHHNHHQQCQTTTANNCCYNHCCFQPPPQQLSADSLLQALSFLLQQQQQQQQPPPDLHCFCVNKPHHNKNHHQNPSFHSLKLRFQQEAKAQYVISSLLERVNALESSLEHLSTTTTGIHYSYSLRDTAARVIQTHFRAFLVRRSRTLRQLKDLAFIKSSFNSLKSFVSSKTHFDSEAVSRKAMDFLLRLDSIQGDDPMIRDGKRSISRDLVRFLDFVDGYKVKRDGISYMKSAKDVRIVGNGNKSRVLNASDSYELNGNKKEIVERLRDRVEKIRGFSRVCENDEEDVELEGFQQFIDDNDDFGVENPRVCTNEKHGVSQIRNGVLVARHVAQPRAKKTVSFAENGNVYRVFSDTHEYVSSGDGSLLDGSDSSGDNGVVENHLTLVDEENGTSNATENGEESEAFLDNGGSSVGSDGERNPRRDRRSSVDYVINGYSCDQDGSLVFSAPLPVKMESRADLMQKRKPAKIVH